MASPIAAVNCLLRYQTVEFGRGFEPSKNRDKRNSRGFTIGLTPQARSAAECPAPGEIPNPPHPPALEG